MCASKLGASAGCACRTWEPVRYAWGDELCNPRTTSASATKRGPRLGCWTTQCGLLEPRRASRSRGGSFATTWAGARGRSYPTGARVEGQVGRAPSCTLAWGWAVDTETALYFQEVRSSRTGEGQLCRQFCAGTETRHGGWDQETGMRDGMRDQVHDAERMGRKTLAFTLYSLAASS